MRLSLRFTRQDAKLSQPATVDLQALFAGAHITSIAERGLGGTISSDEVEFLGNWKRSTYRNCNKSKSSTDNTFKNQKWKTASILRWDFFGLGLMQLWVCREQNLRKKGCARSQVDSTLKVWWYAQDMLMTTVEALNSQLKLNTTQTYPNQQHKSPNLSVKALQKATY